MSFSVGIVGLPNAGKSTLFKALTRQKVDIAPYPFTTINPNVGIVQVPDQRLKKIAEIVKPEKITPTTIKFVDIAGLMKNAHKGEGLGNQFLAHIRECDAILEVVRAFSVAMENASQENKDNSTQCQLWEKPDLKRDIEIVENELIMKDLETATEALEKLEKKAKTQDKEVIKKAIILKKIQETLLKEKVVLSLELVNEEKSLVKEFQFLTLKPRVFVLNVSKEEKPEIPAQASPCLIFNLKLEEEFSELSENELKELKMASQLDSLTVACYNILDLITFYTIAGLKETRAWTIKKGINCQKAAGVVHSDFEERFIKAEVIPWQKLIEAGSWPKAKENGLVRTEGKDCLVQDNDVIEFKI